MQPHATERRFLERHITFSRPVLLVLALVDLLELNPAGAWNQAIVFLGVYLVAAVILAALEGLGAGQGFSLPLGVDLAFVAGFLVFTPSIVSFWFLLLFVAYAAGIRWGWRRAVMLSAAITLALLVRIAIREPVHWPFIVSWAALVAGTFTGGVGAAFLGDRSRRHAGEHEFLARLTGTLQVERGVGESLRAMLNELSDAFDCEVGMLALRDAELERIFVWRVPRGETLRVSAETFPLTRSDAFLLHRMEVNVCWGDLEAPGNGIGWNRNTGWRVNAPPHLPGPARKELQLRSLLAATFEFAGEPVGRVLLGNGRKFSRQDLRWLERIVRHVSAPLENLFLLRHLRARAIEAEHSRISRDLHDGILQTLLSIDIQLDVLRRKLPQFPDQTAGGLAALQQTVRNETEELRRMVTDLRPLRVQSADLVDLMRGFGERFRNESGLALDLLLDSVELQVPDRVCRDLFLIYREALNNIKKHARATHVVVKLWQDDSRVVLVVDDNGEGFSFAGRFTGDELDRLRLGPITIKERTRSVGGVVTVESNPGHGSRLTVEVPFG